MVHASAASAAATVTGNGVFPTALAKGADEAPASAAGTAIPQDGARGTAAARDGVSPIVPIDSTTALNDQPPETATTQRRQTR